jgi:hypothetical protein
MVTDYKLPLGVEFASIENVFRPIIVFFKMLL